MTQGVRTNFISKITRSIERMQLEMAAEGMINNLRRYNPQKLERIHQYLDRPDYPWDSEAENKTFWAVYRSMVKEPFLREKIEREKRGNAESGYTANC